MAYGIFEQITYEKSDYLKPTTEAFSIGRMPRPDGRTTEPLRVYPLENLLAHLVEVIAGETKWDASTLPVDPQINERLLGIQAAPSHCKFFNSRWLDFPGATLPV